MVETTKVKHFAGDIDMREEINALIQKKRHCVMATAADNRPYCSLMAYTSSPDGSKIFMATFRNTRKFRNLTGNPWVSLLIDSRDTAQAQALTVEGRFEEVVDNSKKMQVREMLLADHPN